MRKLKLLVLTLIMGTTSLFASIGNNGATEKLVLENQDVKLTFSINSESEIVVLSVNSEENDILNFVRNNVNGQKIKVKGLKPGKGNKVTVTFSVNSTSNIVVLAVDSKNPDILNYVRQNLNGQKI